MADVEGGGPALPKSSQSGIATEAAKPAAKGAAAAVAVKSPTARAARETAGDEDGKPAATGPNKLRRRLIWTAIWGYLAVNFFMFLRFFYPRALFEPDTVHNLGYPSDFQIGVDEKYKQAYRIWVVKEPPRLFCIFAKCTHLGCTPDWKPAENKFKCPCHGSGYTPEGINFEGPAPRPMDRAHVELNAQGEIIVDTSRLYTWFKAQGGPDHFEDPGASINV
jgi:cytochrome b6-f complex iron-sulfur subunit